MMTLLETIYTRHSVRQYSPDAVPVALLETLLNAALRAPSAHNRQPWRFVVVQQLETRQRLAEVMAARLRRDLAADHVPEDVIARDVHRSIERISSAPVVVVVCLSLADMDHYPDERRQHNEILMAVQSVAMAAQNLLLAAHHAGLGACWMCAPLFSPEEVCAALALPADWQPQGLVTLGYPLPGAVAHARTRHPLEKSVLWR